VANPIPFDLEAMAAIRSSLTSDPDFSAAFPGGVSDEPASDVVFPHVTFGRVEVISDDMDREQAAIVQIGLEVHLRPTQVVQGNRIESLRLCGLLKSILHRAPASLSTTGPTVWDIEVQTYTATRLADAKTYVGTLSLVVSMDA